MNHPDTAVFHLVRARNGPEVLHRFLDSYSRHPAGWPHDLIFILKGFSASAPPHVLHQYPHQTFHVPDVGYDIGAYRAAAAAFNYSFCCFLNSFSEIRAGNWLRKLHQHASSSDVGIVGATGSFESVYSTALEERRNAAGGIRAHLAAALWLQFYRLNFRPFPNPHIRTNGFMLRRDVLLKINTGRQRRKTEALLFESGRRGMSAQVLALGLRLLVVSATGAAFDVEQWPASNTFRLGDQSGLLIADNQTRTYANADPQLKATLARMAWGRHPEALSDT